MRVKGVSGTAFRSRHRADYMTQSDGCRFYSRCEACGFPRCQYEVAPRVWLQWAKERGFGILDTSPGV